MKDKKTIKKRSKKYLEALEKVERTKLYNVDEAVEAVKEVGYTKFPGSIELHINTNQKNLRGLVTLPFASGKTLKIAALGRDAAESGADIVVDDAMFLDIEKGRINFDCLVVTPDQMPKIARLARILGPRGLMPNPKSGTISTDLKKAVSELAGGKTEFKTQKDSQVIHLSVGKKNQESSEVVSNIKALYQIIGKSRIKKLVLAPTMGPSVKINPASL